MTITLEKRLPCLTINQTVDYMAQGFMSFMRGVDITRAIGRVGLKVEPVLGPEIARATASAIWAQNRRGLQGNPIQIPQVMDTAA